MFEHKTCLVVLLVALQTHLTCAFDDTNDGLITLNFEDNVDGKFSSFSKANIHLSRQTNIDLTPSRSVSSAQFERLVDFGADHPYYTLKVHFKRGAVHDHVMTSIPMVLVLQAQFRYTVTLHISENGNVVGVQMTTGNSTCNLSHLHGMEKKSEYSYKASMRLQLSDAGPQPETQRFLEKLKRQQEAKLNAQEADNRPFVLKYWKYILPVVVVLVLQGAFTNDAGAPAAGGQ